MRHWVCLVFSLALAAWSPAAGDTKSEARHAFETYVEALSSGDTETAAAMYDDEDGFHWIERGNIQYETGEEAAASLRELSAMGGSPRMTVDSIRVAELTSDSALLSAHFDFAMLTEDGETQFSFTGWMTVGMLKRPEGWRIAGGQTGPGRTDQVNPN